MKTFSRMIWGFALIALGVIIGGNAMKWFDINIFFDGWWTLFIIVPSAVDVIAKRELSSLIGVLVGVVLLLACQDIVDFGDIWKLILPAVLILIGLSFIFKDVFNFSKKKEIDHLNDVAGDKTEYNATFSGQNIKVDGEFKGVKLSAIFGGIKYDLSEAKIKGKQVLNCTAVFGGIDIILPEDVNVEVVSSSAFGGVSRKRVNKGDGSKIVYINANCAFGGVDIK